MEYVLEAIDFNHVLIVSKNTDVDSFNVDLLRLDLTQLVGTFLSTKEIRGDYFHTFFDYGNRYKFGVYAFDRHSSVRHLFLVNVDRRFRLVVNSQTIKFGDKLYCGRLDGRKLTTLLPKFVEEEQLERKEEFGEYDLVPGRDYPEFQKLADLSLHNDELDHFVVRSFLYLGS
jgi:hypothetical protein